MPVLTIIAGPNGAGKSSNSKDLLAEWNIEAFDFDKAFYNFWSHVDFDPGVEEGAFDRALNHYDDLKTDALEKGRDFAFESNYHTRQIFSTLDQFKSKGYLLRLLFIFLDNVETAKDRVDDRFLKGGHWVDYDTVQYRFDRGLELLDESFDRYDEVYLFQSMDYATDGIAVLNPQFKNVALVMPIPSTLQSRLPRLQDFISRNSW